MRRLALAAAALVVATSSPSVARADVVDRCVDASEKGQRARRSSRLLEARELFVACAAATCPGAVRSACGEWLAAVDASVPSLVVSVEADGQDLPSARVLVDERPVAQGTAARVDPGAHRVVASADGFETTSTEIVAREGEQRRVVHVLLARRAPTQAPAPVADPSAGGGTPPLRIASYVSGGFAVAALGSFTYFAASGRSDASDLRATCAPTCPESARDDVRATYLAADVSLGAAIVLAGVSVALFIASADRPKGR